MRVLEQSLPFPRIFLSFVCAIIALFSFGSIACAASCGGVNCHENGQKSDRPINQGSDAKNGLCGMLGGGCSLCANVIPQHLALTDAPKPFGIDYGIFSETQSTRHIAPDIPPPRSIDIL
jgi:hypothetical protein